MFIYLIYYVIFINSQNLRVSLVIVNDLIKHAIMESFNIIAILLLMHLMYLQLHIILNNVIIILFT